MSRTVTVPDNQWAYQISPDETARMRARSHFGHDNFHEVSRVVTDTEEVIGGDWKVKAVRKYHDITFEEDEQA